MYNGKRGIWDGQKKTKAGLSDPITSNPVQNVQGKLLGNRSGG